jgi:hypothetical protein
MGISVAYNSRGSSAFSPTWAAGLSGLFSRKGRTMTFAGFVVLVDTTLLKGTYQLAGNTIRVADGLGLEMAYCDLHTPNQQFGHGHESRKNTCVACQQELTRYGLR